MRKQLNIRSMEERTLHRLLDSIDIIKEDFLNSGVKKPLVVK